MNIGEIIELWDTDEIVVRGHVTLEEFHAAGKAFYGEKEWTHISQGITGIKHRYARLIPTPYGEFDSELRLCKQGRGAFAVTLEEQKKEGRMPETAGNTERSIDPVRRIETAMEQASGWGLEFIKSIDDLKAENARLRERLAQAEGLLREAEEATQDKFEIDVADAMCQLLPRITTFLHPEKEKPCNS